MISLSLYNLRAGHSPLLLYMLKGNTSLLIGICRLWAGLWKVRCLISRRISGFTQKSYPKAFKGDLVVEASAFSTFIHFSFLFLNCLYLFVLLYPTYMSSLNSLTSLPPMKNNHLLLFFGHRMLFIPSYSTNSSWLDDTDCGMARALGPSVSPLVSPTVSLVWVLFHSL